MTWTNRPVPSDGKISRVYIYDEWDYVIENYFIGANHPEIIDSVAGIAFVQPPIPEGYEGAVSPPLVRTDPFLKEDPSLKAARIPEPTAVPQPSPQVNMSKTAEQSITIDPEHVRNSDVAGKKATAPSIEQKFAGRTNKLQTVIPVTAEKIELRFYDNAQVDGDSIALFLNGVVVQNIRLPTAYTVRLNASDLGDEMNW